MIGPEPRRHANGNSRRHGLLEAGSPALLSAASGRRHAVRARDRARERGPATRQPLADGGARGQAVAWKRNTSPTLTHIKATGGVRLEKELIKDERIRSQSDVQAHSPSH